MRVEGQDLYVRVGGVVKGAKWLEHHLYQVSAAGPCAGLPATGANVKFEVTVRDCPIHGAADV